ncbi:hypothetical protein GQ457_13G018570 [Hibiscus cannabinus]
MVGDTDRYPRRSKPNRTEIVAVYLGEYFSILVVIATPLTVGIAYISCDDAQSVGVFQQLVKGFRAIATLRYVGLGLQLLGAYEDEEAAAHAYDLAALKYWGSQDTILNFPLATYQNQLKEMEGQSKEEYIGSLRRKSSGFSRGVSKYRGVARHHHNGRWEARIGRVSGNKYLYLGTYATQEEAATAYDMAAIEYRGLNAVTNFDLSRYIKWLRPNPQSNPNDNSEILNGETISTTSITPPQLDGDGGNSASSALGFLLKSSKFKEMKKRTPTVDCPSTSLESDPPRRSFPDDIQTYFGCQDSNNYTEGDDIVFGDINTFATPMFHCELDC